MVNLEKQKDSLNILHIAPIAIQVSRSLKYAGTERIVLALNQVYHEQGHNSLVAASGDSNLGPYGHLIATIPRSLWDTKGIERKTIDLGANFYSNHYEKSLEFALHNDIDIIQDNPGEYVITSEEYSNKRINIPIITTIHGDVSATEEEKYSKFRKLQEKDTKVFFVSISESQKRKYEKYAGIRIDRVIYNGVPIDELYFQEKKQDYLLWLGRISSIKGADLAIQVARKTKRPLIIAGEVHLPHKYFYEKKIAPYLTESINFGSSENQESRRTNLIERLQDGNKIVDEGEILFIGPVDNRQKAVLYANATALLQPNRWEEPFGLVMAEALSAGTPVIGTNTGSIPEIIRDGITGYVIEPEYRKSKCSSNSNMENIFDDKAMVEDLIFAVNNVNKISPRECRADAATRFSQNVMGKNYLKFYKEILSNISK